MTTILDELRLTELATSSPGHRRLVRPRSWPRPATRTGSPPPGALAKHAGLAPREKLAGIFVGRTKLTGQGRPGPRLAAWRGVWGARRANPVYAARLTHLTRAQDKLTVTQAQAVIAAAILRQLHAVITTGQRWDPVIATHRHHTTRSVAHRRLRSAGDPSSKGRASPTRHRGTTSPRLSSGAAPSVVSPIRLHAAGTNPITAMQGQTTDEAPDHHLTKRLALMTAHGTLAQRQCRVARARRTAPHRRFWQDPSDA